MVQKHDEAETSKRERQSVPRFWEETESDVFQDKASK